MEVSPSVTCSGADLCRWSPNGAFLAHAKGARLIIRDAATLKVMASHVCLANVDLLRWSASSEFVLASSLSQATTHLFCSTDPGWTAKISEGAVGLTSAVLAPDSRHVLSKSELDLRLTIWSLTSKKVRYIKFALHLDFSPCGQRLAVAERQSDASSAALAVYDSCTWEELARTDTACSDPAGVLWQSSTGDFVAIWEGPLKYLFQVKANLPWPLLTHSSLSYSHLTFDQRLPTRPTP